MDIGTLISQLTEAIECEPDSLKLETRFKDLPNWDSMAALSIIAMADEYYGRAISGDDLKSANTVGDLIALLSR